MGVGKDQGRDQEGRRGGRAIEATVVPRVLQLLRPIGAPNERLQE